MSSTIRNQAEWLEGDGLGGFASGTVGTIRTRRYHALLLAATRPPGGRMVLVNGIEVWAETSAGRFALSSDRYNPGVVHPDGTRYIEAFEFRPYPRWRFALPDGTRIEQGIVVAPGRASTLMYWKLIEGSRGTLEVRPFISGIRLSIFAPRSTADA
jgi:predicted glycogen debranching enzyme